jgi:sugar O-acyltransferase (sialic acid O-acetyltransferase NeuD family)
MQNILIVGAGAFGRDVFQFVRDTFLTRDGYRLTGFLDDARPPMGPFGLDVEVIGTPSNYRVEETDRFLVAVGDPKIHRDLTAQIAGHGGKFLTLIHPTAYVATTAEVGEGNILAPFTFVGPNAILAAHVVLNRYASVGHDARIGEHSILCPYATVNGRAVLSEGVFLGSHSTITPRIRVGPDSKIAAGSVVYQDVPEHGLAVGNPAKAHALYPK